MKPVPPNEQDPKLAGLLKRWKVDAALPPRFQERVWERIALAEAARSNHWTETWFRLQSLLTRPGLAATYLTALLTLGFFIGWAQGQQENSRVERALRTRYVQVLDPYQGIGF